MMFDTTMMWILGLAAFTLTFILGFWGWMIWFLGRNARRLAQSRETSSNQGSGGHRAAS